MSKSKLTPAYYTVAQTMERLGYKTRKSVDDLVAAGLLTPIKSPLKRGKHAPRIFFDASQVEQLVPDGSRLSRPQAAEILGVHVRTVDRMAKSGELTAYIVENKIARRKRRVEFDAGQVADVKAKLIALGQLVEKR